MDLERPRIPRSPSSRFAVTHRWSCLALFSSPEFVTRLATLETKLSLRETSPAPSLLATFRSSRWRIAADWSVRQPPRAPDWTRTPFDHRAPLFLATFFSP